MIKEIRSVEQIKSLWQKCFNDEKEIIDNFVDTTFSKVNWQGYYIGNKLVGMCCVIKGFYKNEQFNYLYACCVDGEYRNKGIMRKLIENINLPIVLVLENESLRAFYEKLNFRFYGKTKDVKENLLDFGPLASFAEEFYRNYGAKFGSYIYVKFEKDYDFNIRLCFN